MSDQITGQIELLDYLASFNQEPHKYKITKPIRLIETFSGIGCQMSAFKRLDYPFESWKTSEWDVNSVKMYNAMHVRDYTDYSEKLTVDELIDWLDTKGCSIDGKVPLPKDKIKRKGERWIRETYNNYKAIHNIGSIITAHASDLEIVDKDKYTYLLTYSWPCTSISVAGKGEGYTKGSGTASSLLWEIGRILEECKEFDCLPEVLIAENVSMCHGKKYQSEFNTWLGILDSLGYTTFWTDMNGKDYGIPQNRLRCFIVSILKKNVSYSFPEPIELKTCMKDFLEESVDEKYYINSEKARKLIQSLIDRKELP